MSVDKLLQGYRRFRDGVFETHRPLAEDLVEHGQRPEVAIVACVDSRVDPALILQADPGDMLVIRNVANLVPPVDQEGTFHGTSAAIEFAVLGLGVKHLVVLGHAHCGGVAKMMAADQKDDTFTFLPTWVSQLSAAHRRVKETLPDADAETQTRACEQNAVLVSLENLRTFPWVRSRVESGDLELHGWYIDIGTGELSAYDGDTGEFAPID